MCLYNNLTELVASKLRMWVEAHLRILATLEDVLHLPTNEIEKHLVTNGMVFYPISYIGAIIKVIKFQEYPK